MITASGGLKEPAAYDRRLVHFQPEIPYEWIFSRVYGVIHHGGSGTTPLGLRYGCATMIIPHIIDQFVWNRIIDGIGAGPKGIRIGKVNADNLEQKIRDLIGNDSYKQVAEKVGSQMREEDFGEEIYDVILQL